MNWGLFVESPSGLFASHCEHNMFYFIPISVWCLLSFARGRTCLKHFIFWQMVFGVLFMLHSVNLETGEVTVRYLLSKNVWPLSPDKVPCQRLANHIACNLYNGGCGILFPDQGWIQCVLQIPKKQISRQHVCKSVTVNDVLSNEVQ